MYLKDPDMVEAMVERATIKVKNRLCSTLPFTKGCLKA